MSSIFGAGLGVFIVLPVLIAQWLGVIGLAKSGRNGAWWCMAVGTGLSTLGMILGGLLFFWMFRRSGGSQEIAMFAVMMVGGASGLGSLVFSVGFGIHGMMSKKMRQRIEELESVLAAQGEQLNRQDQVGKS
jgi:hypothetical protein